MDDLPSQEFCRQVPLTVLIPCLQGLRRELDSSVGPERSMSSLVVLICPQCGIELTPEEVDRLSGSADKTTPAPRWRRLVAGYCARHGCDSHYYDIAIRGPSGLDAPRLWEAVEPMPWPEENEDTQPLVGPMWAGLRARVRDGRFWVPASLALALVILAWWHFRTPNWATRSSGYQVAPASIEQPGTDQPDG